MRERAGGLPVVAVQRPSGRARRRIGNRATPTPCLPGGSGRTSLRLRAAQDAGLPDLVPIRVGGAVAWVVFQRRDAARMRRGRQRTEAPVTRLGRAVRHVLRMGPARGDIAGVGEVRAGVAPPSPLPRCEQPGCNRVRGHDTTGPDEGHGRIVPFVEDSGIDAA